MEFLLSLVKLKVTDLIQLYPLIVNAAIAWTLIENVVFFILLL
jgi:hypothetical protein